MTEVNTEFGSVGSRNFPAGVDAALVLVSGVSWAAILAGATGAAALSLLLLFLGTGLGLSVVSPWSMEGISATTFGFAAIAWMSFTQLAASGMGGYLSGRLRNKWTGVHTDEVYFRDTAHGFLTWAVASLLTAAVLTSVIATIVGGGVRAGAAVVGGATSAVGMVAGTAAGSAAMLTAGGTGSGEVNNTIEYFVDSLFRGDAAGSVTEQRNVPAEAQRVSEPAREVSGIPAGEVMRIFAQALRAGTLPLEDERYIGRLIAQRTGLSQQEAEQRVSEGFKEVLITLEEMETTAREAAEEARETSAYGALWMSVTLLMGAFTASLMAIFGGRQRDA